MQEEHVGSDFTGVPKMVADAGGEFVAMYGEIGVGIATARDLSFGSKLVAADSRLHAVGAHLSEFHKMRGTTSVGSGCLKWGGHRGALRNE